MVSTLDSESSDLSSNLSGTCYLLTGSTRQIGAYFTTFSVAACFERECYSWPSNSQFQSPPTLHICMFLSSLQAFVLFERKCPAKWTSQDIPPRFQLEKNVCSIQRAFMCARREFKLYIFTEVYYVTIVLVWRRCTKQIQEWMCWNEVNFNRFPLLRE